MSNIKAKTLTASIADGAAASATAHTFSTSAGDCPAKVEMFAGTTPNYANAVNTTVFIISSAGTVLWSGGAVARNTAKTWALSAYDVYVVPGDYVYVTDSADNGGTAVFTFQMRVRTLDQ